MKGVSTVIAHVIMLIIVVSLAVLIYGYVSGTFLPSKFISLLTASCSNQTGEFYLMVKNQNNLLRLNADEELKVFIDGIPVSVNWNPVEIPPNGVTQGTIIPPPEISTALGARHTILVAGPSNSEERTPVYC